MNNKTEYDLQVIKMSLEELRMKKYINEEELNKLFELYKMDDRNIEDINDEISKFPIDGNLMKEKIKLSSNVSKLAKETSKPKSSKLSLENITDFQKDGKPFIKIHYPYPSDDVRILENSTNPYISAKEIFNSIKDKMPNNVEGAELTTKLFEDELATKYIEPKLYNYNDQNNYIEFDKLTEEEKKNFIGLKEVIYNNKKKFEDKIVRVCLPEKLVIISTPNEPTKDEVKKIEFNKEKDRYELVPLDSKGYKYDNQDNMDQDTNTLENDASEDLDEEKELNEEEELQKEGEFKNIDKGISYKKRRKK